ncbi:unnamed protein product [Choristocarpus tenellus]
MHWFKLHCKPFMTKHPLRQRGTQDLELKYLNRMYIMRSRRPIRSMALTSKTMWKIHQGGLQWGRLAWVTWLCIGSLGGIGVWGVQLDVQGGKMRCIKEAAREDTPTTFSFKVVKSNGKPPKSNIWVQVKGPDRKNFLNKRLTETSETYNVKTNAGGSYEICFTNRAKDSKTRVEFSETSGVKEDIVPQVKKEYMQPLERLLHSTTDAAQSIDKDMQNSIANEMDLKKMGDTLNSRITLFSIFTVVILLSVSAWQLVLLNKFFRRVSLLMLWMY